MIKLITNEIPDGQDWLRQVWEYKGKKFETILPPRHAANGSIRYNTDAAKLMATNILCRQ